MTLCGQVFFGNDAMDFSPSSDFLTKNVAKNVTKIYKRFENEELQIINLQSWAPAENFPGANLSVLTCLNKTVFMTVVYLTSVQCTVAFSHNTADLSSLCLSLNKNGPLCLCL